MASTYRAAEAIGTLMTVFYEYAAKDCEEGKEKPDAGEVCSAFKLSKKELKELLQKEFDMEKVKDEAKLNEVMKELDDDGDGQVNFEEYLSFVVVIARAINAAIECIADISTN